MPCGYRTCTLITLLVVFAMPSRVPAGPRVRALADNRASHFVVPADQAPGWSAGFEAPGVNGDVLVLAHFDRDLIVGGRFTTAGNTSARYVARWDGIAWQPLDNGLAGIVRALIVFDGSLIAAGDFVGGATPFASNVARWSGETWEPLPGIPSGTIHALHIHDGKLIVGGRFTIAADPRPRCVAQWDGRAWRPLAAGVEPLDDGDVVRSLVSYDATLIAGGSFNQMDGVAARSIARWNGREWRAVGRGFDRPVEALVVHDNRLVAGGSFGIADGVDGRSIAMWNGASWSALAHGVPGSFPTTRALLTYRGALLAAGSYADPAGGGANTIMRWDGSSWSRVGGPIDGGASVFALTEFAGELFAAGSFADADDTVVNRIARLQRERWTPLTEGAGVDSNIRALSIYRGDVIAGGDFSRAGARRAHSVARWDGGHWHALGDGVDGIILALHVYRDAIVAAGSFTLPGDSRAAANVATWNGTAWDALGNGLKGHVVELLEYRGDLYAAGVFSGLRADDTVHLARWDGNKWHDPGLTIDTGFGQPSVNALAIYNDELVLGGRFDRVNRMAIRNVVATDGVGWYALEDGVDEVVDDLAVHDGRLFLGGFFNFAGQRFAPQIAAWDGESWSATGRGLIFDDFVVLDAVVRLHATPAALLLGGRYDGVDGVQASNLAAWDGEQWQALGDGANGSTLAFATLDDALFVGGRFDRVGGIPSSRLAKWEWALPVQSVQDFAAALVEDAIELRWRIAAPLVSMVSTIRILREDPGSNGVPEVVGAAVASEGAMHFTDRNVAPHTRYTYRVELERVVGAPLSSSILTVATGALHRTRLGTISDALGGPVQVRYSVGTPNLPVTLRVFDVRGHFVRQLAAGPHGRGAFVAPWDRRTERGQRASRGVYFVRMQLRDRLETRKFVLLHD